MRVTGYIDGVAYTLTTGPANGDDGVVASASPVEVYAKIASLDGEEILMSPVGPRVVAGFGSDEAVYAALLQSTEIIAVVDGPVVQRSTDQREPIDN